MPQYKDIQLPGFERGLTVGAIEIGNSVSTFLLGVLTLQVYNYFRAFKGDPVHIKVAVGVMYIFDIVHTVLLSKTVYFYTVTGPCDPAALDHIEETLVASIPFLGLIALIVQTLYCMRVFRVAGSLFLALGCWSLALTRFAFHIYTASLAQEARSLHHAVTWHKFRVGLLASLASATAADIAICACIVTGLWKRKTGFQKTDELVERVIMFTIGSGMLPTAIGLIEVITYCLMPKNFVWMGFWFVMSKALSNSLLVSLNQRTSYARPSTDQSIALGSSNLTSSSGVTSGPNFRFDKAPTTSGIRMELSTASRSDPADDFNYPPRTFKRDERFHHDPNLEEDQEDHFAHPRKARALGEEV